MTLGTRPANFFLPFSAITLALCSLQPLPSIAQSDGNPPNLAGLAERIDAILGEDPEWMLGEKLPDGLLLRRLSLDLRNVVPTQEELDSFLADHAENRWPRWVDRFQRDPLASERLVDWYDKTLMQRRPFQQTDRAAWLQLLRQTVDERKGIDVFLRTLVTSAWWNRSQRAEQRFFLDRGGDPHAIARDLGRIFFGRDMQCAQCHDHPQIDDYLQIDYHGLLAFVSASSMVEGTTKDEKGADQKVQLYIERAAGDAPFESVFDKGIKFRTATRAPGQTERIEPYAAPDQRYQTQAKPESFAGIGPPPLASRREMLASHLNSSNRAFAENWSNRLWAVMFGRGIVHPLDMHHSDNPPSNSKLLAAVTDTLIAAQFDAPAVLAELAKTRAYQRAHRLPVDAWSDEHAVVTAPPEQLAPLRDAFQSRTSMAKTEHARLVELQNAKHAVMEQARTTWRAIQQERAGLRAELDAAEGAFNESQKKVVEAQKVLDQAIVVEQSAAAKITLLDEAVQKLEQARSAPDDPELNPAIAAAKTRADQMRGALPAQQQAVAAATANRDAAATAREGERAKWQSIVDKLAPVEQRLLESDRALVQSRLEHDVARAEANAVFRLQVQSERFQRWLDLSAEIAAKRSQRKQLEQQYAEGLPALASYQSQVDVAQQTVAAVEAKRMQHDERMALVAKDIASIEAEIMQLQTAKKSLIDSASLVGDASAFASAAAELDRSHESRRTKLTEINANIAGMTEQRIAMNAEFDAAIAGREQAKAKWNEFDLQLKSLLAQHDQVAADLDTQIKQCEEARMAVSADRQNQHAIGAERPLSPEQLAWSILRSTDVLHSYIANEQAELDKQGVVPADATEEQKREREKRVVRGALDKLRGNVDVFSSLYSSGVGQTSDEFFASPDQALYFANGGAVHSWSGPNGANISSRVLQATDPQQAARQMYWALLSREPTAIEQQFIAEQITNAGEQRPAVVQELVWSILAGAEYRMYP